MLYDFTTLALLLDIQKIIIFLSKFLFAKKKKQ